MPRKKVGKKLDVNGTLQDLGNTLSDEDLSKLDGIEEGAQKNVQSDWNATSGDSFIKNKPTIPTNTNQLTNGAGFVTSSGSVATATNATKLNNQSASYYLNYNNLSNKPSIPPRHSKSGDSGRTSGVYTYYKLASFPTDNSGNSSSLTIDGRIGGWNKGNKGYLSMIISNRDGISGTGSLYGNADLSLCDLVVYTSGSSSSGSTATLYIKTYSWFAYDFTLGTMSGTSDIYDGAGSTTTPSGTLQWTLSGNINNFFKVKDDGTVYQNGKQLANKEDIPSTSGFVNTSSDQTVGGTKTFSNAIISPYYKSDNSTASFKLSDNNELNFGSNGDTIFFGYQYSRIPGNTGIVSRYNFGNSQGNGTGGSIFCNKLYVENGSKEVATKEQLGTQATFSLSGTTLTITPK